MFANAIAPVAPLTPILPGDRFRSQLWVWFALGVLAATYLWFVSAWFLNVPRGDDLGSILPFAEAWREAGSAERFRLLFAQYFSHRIVGTRLFAIAVDGIFGHLQLVVFHLFGLGLWLCIVAWFVRRSVQPKHCLFFALVPALLLLQPAGRTNLSVAMQSVQNLGVLALGLASVCLAVRSGRWSFSAALALGLVAIITSANGLIVAPLVSLAAWRTGRRRLAVVGLALWGLCAALYFRGFAASGVGTRGFSVLEFATNTLAMLGSPFDLYRLPMSFSIAAGAVLLAAGSGVILTAFWRRMTPDPVILFAAFLLASIMLCAAGRMGWGAGYMGQDRYRPYGLLFASCLWIARPAVLRSHKAFLTVAVATSALVAASAYTGLYANRLEERRWDEAIIVNQRLGHTMVHEAWHGGASAQARSVAKDIWRPPAGLAGVPSSQFIVSLRSTGDQSAAGPAHTAMRHEGRGVYVLASIPPPSAGAEFGVLLLPTGPVLLPALAERNTYLNMLRGKGLTNRTTQGFLLPVENPPLQSCSLLGLGRSPSGEWRVLWVAPTLPLAP